MYFNVKIITIQLKFYLHIFLKLNTKVTPYNIASRCSHASISIKIPPLIQTAASVSPFKCVYVRATEFGILRIALQSSYENRKSNTHTWQRTLRSPHMSHIITVCTYIFKAVRLKQHCVLRTSDREGSTSSALNFWYVFENVRRR